MRTERKNFLVVSASKLPPLPHRFSASIGGFMGDSYDVELHDDTLTYTTFDSGHQNPKHFAIVPTATQWREFRQTLDDLKIWNWRAEYRNNVVCDGTQWSLDIAYSDCVLKTVGDNSYPDATGKPNDKPGPTTAFTRYLEAIRTLIGGKAFE